MPPPNPVGFPPVRRGAILQLTLLALVAAAITTAVAVLIPWMPEQASREAQRINFTFWFMTIIAIFVFSIVCAVLGYALIHFRVKPGDLSDGPPIHGHTGLEIAWTIVPFVLVTAVAIVSAVVLSKNSDAGPNPVKVTVIGQQFDWTFKYPNGQTYPILRLPEGKKVDLTIESVDVLHSFWVPQMMQKQDAVPGLPTHLTITPIRLGTFPVICVELCGLGHSTMRSEAVVMSAAAYDKWLNAKPAAPPSTGTSSAAGSGLATFKANGCSACHTLTAAGATGTIGPDLDKLSAEAAKAGQPLDDFIKTSIIDPGAYVAPGYPNGVMPTTFKSSIPGPALDQLVQYLASNAK
jgi:cytochrome c oxidase subunit II